MGRSVALQAYLCGFIVISWHCITYSVGLNALTLAYKFVYEPLTNVTNLNRFFFISSQLGCYYIFLICLYILQSDTYMKILNVGEDVIFGPSVPNFTDQHKEVKWFYNYSNLIMYWNQTYLIYNGTNARHDSRPYKVRICNVKLENTGNYTIQITDWNKRENQTYDYMLLVTNRTLRDSSTVAQQMSLSSSLHSCNCYIYFMVIIEYLYLTQS
uniref:Glycoprotein vIgFam2 n=1 Tax=Elephant endotheliotropic herpesvirus 1A TaxID=759753 RepID=A0A866VUN0_ELHV1|nr:glycoprotein vIgFam2 [Elephant endotheliotropic herpesvirus 1A]